MGVVVVLAVLGLGLVTTPTRSERLALAFRRDGGALKGDLGVPATVWAFWKGLAAVVVLVLVLVVGILAEWSLPLMEPEPIWRGAVACLLFMFMFKGDGQGEDVGSATGRLEREPSVSSSLVKDLVVSVESFLKKSSCSA